VPAALDAWLPSTRVFALSDVHVDVPCNMAWLQELSAAEYAEATLILAGDVTDSLERLRVALSHLCATFAHVFFVPGNHELWVRRQEYPDSLAKFERIVQLCDALGVHTRPAKVGTAQRQVWIVPLYAWYVGPEEGDSSLFVPKPGEDPTLRMWSDRYFVRWPAWQTALTAAEYFLALNEPHLLRSYDAPVLSFSHFLPRTDLVFRHDSDGGPPPAALRDPHPSFNFTRVAGCTGLDVQIRQLGAMTHVYGHQHRNRDRLVDGVRYISHCLGYPRERQRVGWFEPIERPKLVWDCRDAEVGLDHTT
jgi:predicted phosphodiesterase